MVSYPLYLLIGLMSLSTAEDDIFGIAMVHAVRIASALLVMRRISALLLHLVPEHIINDYFWILHTRIV